MHKINIIFILVLLVVGCCNNDKSNKKQENLTDYKKIEEIQKTKKIPLLKVVDSSLCFWLDSIIIQEKECYFYDSVTSACVIDIYQVSSLILIDVSSTNKFGNCHLNSDGIFFYKDFPFITNRQVSTNIFNETNDSVLINYKYLSSYENVIDYSEVLSYWHFIYKNNSISFRWNYKCLKEKP